MSTMSSIQATAKGRADIHEPREDHFDPEETLIHTLRRAIANRQDVVVAQFGVGELYLLPARGECHVNYRDEARFYGAAVDSVEVRCLNPEEVDAVARRGHGRNLDEIMWRAGYYASKGRLIKGCFRDDVVELRHWPNLTRVPTTANAMAITALLTRYPTSITFAGRLLKVPASEMYQFYTAAHCAGLARVLNRKPEMPKLPPHKNRTLLSQLLSRIAGM